MGARNQITILLAKSMVISITEDTWNRTDDTANDTKKHHWL